MAKDLKKTILIENEDYNINAVYSDEAGKVTTPLVIKESGIKVGEYYGSTDTSETTRSEINYVPATGGKFTNKVLIDNKHGNSVGGVLDEEIINFGQMKTKISQLTGATLYNWTTSGELVELEKNTSEYYKLNTIVGRTVDLPDLESYSEGRQKIESLNIDPYMANPVSYSSQGDYYNAYFNVANEASSANPLASPVIINSVYSNKPVKIKDSGFEGRTYVMYSGSESKLTQIHINPGVSAIGTKAFKDCANLESIIIPDSVTTIGASAFEGCAKLDKVNLSSGVSKIQTTTFKNCTSLTEITIGYQTTEIAPDAFYGCTNLKNIYFTGTRTAWERINEGENPFIDDETVTVHFGDLPFPFLYICDDGESDTSLTSNKMFLKMPGEDLIEVSKGAVRLERPSANPNSDSNYKYYTYDTLAAIIAGINSRLTALGSKTLALPEKLIVSNTEHVAVPEISDDIISADEDKAIIVEETIAPTVFELQEQIVNITGKDYLDRKVTNFFEAYKSGCDFSNKIIEFSVPSYTDSTNSYYDIIFKGTSSDDYYFSVCPGQITFNRTDIGGALYYIYDEDEFKFNPFPLPNDIGKVSKVLYNHQEITFEEFSSIVTLNFTTISKSERDIQPIPKAAADASGRTIETGYYRSADKVLETDITANINTISIVNKIPTNGENGSEKTPGTVGDIMIVI